MKILITYVSAGAGHFKAAEALYFYCQKHKDWDVRLVDALDYANPFFKKGYSGIYTFLVSRMPQVWGGFFALLDIPWMQWFYRRVRRLFNFCNAWHFHEFLREEKFDCILSTHFMPTEVAAALKRSKRIDSKVITVVTDFDVHRIWIAKGVDCYTAASDWTKNKLKTLGIPDDQICVSGIPTDEKFAQNFDRLELKKKLGLQEEVFTVLIATGSFGIGPIQELVEELSKEGFQVLVICGHNKDLLERLQRKPLHLVKAFGFVSNVHELMAVSDVMVTKPGGLSISEALVIQLPLIFFHPIPGQEANNIKVLKNYGIGSTAQTIEEIVEQLKNLRSSRDVFLSVLKKMSVLSGRNAAQDIIKRVE